MKTFTRHSILFPALLILLFSACERTDDDILKLMPENTHLMFENNYIQVLNVVLEPGQGQPLHQCGNRLIYARNDYTINYHQPDDTTEISWNKGGVHWHEKGYHAVENVGETLADYLVIERTETALPAAVSLRPEAEVAPLPQEHVTEIFENNHARVMRITLPPGKSIPEHDGPNRLVYSLSQYEIQYTSETAGTVEREFNEGDFHWHTPGYHSIKNIGETDAEFIIFGFLQ